MMRFTIRDLLWLMVVVGLAVGWWIDRSRISRLQSDLDRSQGELGHLSRAVWEGGYDPRVIIRDPRRELKRAKLQVDPKTKALRVPAENSLTETKDEN